MRNGLTTCRFIPAHAGNRTRRQGKGRSIPVHPRTRGEQASHCRRVVFNDGSSPHTRGTVRGCNRGSCRRRFIPAHAGNSAHDNRSPLHVPVHPRTRGEQTHCAYSGLFIPGSSPHTRGTGGSGIPWRALRRFIPAHAGNRNENLSLSFRRIGSSPHTRGTASSVPRYVFYERFIPAHAGNRYLLAIPARNSSVHPRTRGEQLLTCYCKRISAGSSPHTRGTVQADSATRHTIRFIPAHAGNSRDENVPVDSESVHPRTRGEQPIRPVKAPLNGGSSPHTRGTVKQSYFFFFLPRFIPAHAGNSKA